MIYNYDDFIKALQTAGFSMGGGNADGIYAVITWGWQQDPPYPTPVSWHTGDPETDPWEWINRVLAERKDIAYGKLFFRKSGYITEEWFSPFLSVRRAGVNFDEAYADGTISHFAKRIYEAVAENGRLPVEEIKRIGGFSREDKSGFDRALVELQMKMFISPCGLHTKRQGWASTIFCPAEQIYGTETDEYTTDDAFDIIREQILKLNPSAEEKKIAKFIRGF